MKLAVRLRNHMNAILKNGRIKNSNKFGFTLVELMITLGIGTVLMAAISTVLVQSTQQQTKAMGLIQIDLVRRNMIMALSSDQAWAKSISMNSTSMACLNGTSACTPNNPQPFALYDEKNLIFDAATNSQNGLTLRGEPCPSASNPASFDLIHGNDNCPFRYDLKWSAACVLGQSPDTCVDPQVLVSAKLLYRPGINKIVISPARYSIAAYYRAPLSKQLCGAANGSSTATAPTTNLCIASAAASAVSSGPGEWLWTCTASGFIEYCWALLAGPAVDCAGTLGACSVSCGGGTQTFTVTTPPQNGGVACPVSPQACNTQSCSAPVDCVGGWGACSVACGGGTQTYTVTTPAQSGGAACPVSNGTTQACNTQACAPCSCSWVDSGCNTAACPGQVEETYTCVPANCQPTQTRCSATGVLSGIFVHVGSTGVPHYGPNRPKLCSPAGGGRPDGLSCSKTCYATCTGSRTCFGQRPRMNCTAPLYQCR